MIDEATKQRYIGILNRLRVISNKIDNLNNSVLGLENKMKQSILINNSVYKNEEIAFVKSNLNSASSTIKSNIIPSLNRKINS